MTRRYFIDAVLGVFGAGAFLAPPLLPLVGDGRIDDTAALQQRIDRTQPMRIRGNTVLHASKAGIVLA